MKRFFCFTLLVLLTGLGGPGVANAAAAQSKGANSPSVLYVCGCDDKCTCNSLSKKPGKCTCGKKMIPTHVLKIEGTEAVLCQCGKDCTCQIDKNDPTKCGCGKPVKRVSLKGKYICGCGPDCQCNSIANKPGKCKCGKKLVKVE